MGLNASLGIATSGLLAINQQFAVISQNVSNANSPDYSNETAALSAVSAGAEGLGVVSGGAALTIDKGVQTQVLAQSAAASGASTTAAALSAIDQTMGTVGNGDDIGSLLGGVQSAFSTLLADPSNAAQQQAVVGAAQALTGKVNAIGNAITTGRQDVQSDLQASLGQLNTALAAIGTLNGQIADLSAAGESTADLENQRNAAETTVSGLVGARFAAGADGRVGVFTQGGAQLPTDGSLLSMAASSIGAASFYPGGGIGGVMLNGADVTGALTGGRIGADIALRDTALPALQAGLDQFSYSLSSRFSAEGMSLFTDASGVVPTAGGPLAQSGYVGLSSTLAVNPAVAADPAQVRDGTGISQNTMADAGFSGVIQNVLTYALGADTAAGAAQPAPATAGLGAGGTLGLSYSLGGTLADQASAFTAAEAAGTAAANTANTNAASLRTALQTTLGQSAGVNVDQQMSTMVALQNSYAANAKMISAIQEMMQTVIGMVQ